METRLLIALGIFILESFFISAANGDILATDLYATAAASSESTQGRREILSGAECYPGGSGVCVKVTLTMGPEGHYTAWEPWTLEIPDSSEMTIVYYEKMNPFPTWVGGGIKSHRPYFYNTGGEATQGWLKPYFGAIINFHCNEGCGTYMNAFDSGDIIFGPKANYGSPYFCPGGHCVGNGETASVNAVFSNLNNDGISGFGTGWRKIRNYIKMPSSNSNADGRNTYWIDEELIYDLTNVGISYMENNNNRIYKIAFSPQDDSGIAFSHYYDDITIYEGYVPPSGAANPYCGDRSCNNAETCSSCPGDCGVCTCTPSWTCSGFGACVNNIKTQTCTDSNNCGTTIGRPTLTQSCTPDPNAIIITVDSTYPGYSTGRIDDGIKDASGMEESTWASAESSSSPHWIEFVFSNDKYLSNIDIYWAYNSVLQHYMSSQEMQVQYWDGSKFVTVATIRNTGSAEKSSASFGKVSTVKLRLYQPPGKGASVYPNVLWVAEVDYGNCAHQSDVDCNGCIGQDELLAFITEWKSGQVTIGDLMGAIAEWKSGC